MDAHSKTELLAIVKKCFLSANNNPLLPSAKFSITLSVALFN